MHKEYDLGRLLVEAYVKVLRVNLTTDTYEEIKVNDNERNVEQGYDPTISGWLRHFAETGNVHADDCGRYNVFTRLESLQRAFAVLGKQEISILYRRRTESGDYHWVRMTFQRSYDYTDDNQLVMLYVDDVNDVIDLSQELAEQQQIRHALVHMYFVALYVNMDDNTYKRLHVAKEIERRVPEKGSMYDVMALFNRELVVPNDNEAFMENYSPDIIRERLVNQRSYDYEFPATTGSGEMRCRIAAIRVDRHGDGRPRHIIIAMQDVTDRADWV